MIWMIILAGMHGYLATWHSAVYLGVPRVLLSRQASQEDMKIDLQAASSDDTCIANWGDWLLGGRAERLATCFD